MVRAILKTEDFATHLVAFVDELRARGKSEATVASYSTDVRLFLKFLHDARLTSEDFSPSVLHSYRQFLVHDCASRENSVRRKIIVIKQFFIFLEQGGVISTNPFERTAIPSRDEEHNNHVQAEELATVLTHLKRVGDYRGAAILHLLAFEGIKATELVSLEWEHLVFAKFSALLRIGGSRARAIKLQPATVRALRSYRQTVVVPRGLMFKGHKGANNVISLPALTRHGLKFLLHRLATRVRVPSLSPERLRHHAIVHLLVGGKTPEEVRAHLGLRRMGNVQKHVVQLAR